MTASRILHILTGEYPPRLGGVGDYAAQLADAIAAEGVEVHLWSTSDAEARTSTGATVHRDGGRWSPADLARLGRTLDGFPTPRFLLVQYTPNAWGRKGLNLNFCRWLRDRRRQRGDVIRVMFHEVAYPWQFRDRPTRWLLAAGQRRMARLILEAAAEVDVSIPAWATLLRSLAPGDRRAIGWRPIPSNVPVADDPSARERVAPGGETVIGSFGAFSALIGPLLESALPPLVLNHPDRVALLIGQGSDRFASVLLARRPALAGRVVATGSLATREISTHLQACDLLIQPYPDGVTTRRTTLMAALSHGIAAVTNAGHLTEPFWAGSNAVALAPSVDGLVSTAERVLNDPARRARLGASGRALYEQRFALKWTVEALVGPGSWVGT